MADVFISYSRKDKDFVSTLYAAFERSQKNIWVDWNNIPLTSDWWAEIEKGIEGADTFVFVISPDSIASEICGKEILHAVRNNKRLFPIVRRDATNFEKGNFAHDKISELNWLWFREQDDFEKSFRTLTDSLLLDLEHLHQHTRLVVRANEWDKGRSDSLLLRGDDLANAELWLGESVGKDPQPTELQETYIKKSRDVEAASDRAAAIIQEALEESKKKAAEAAANLEESEKKAALRIKIGSGILAGTILLALVAGVSATKFVNEANVKVDKTEKEAKDMLKNADLAVVTAQKNADDIKNVSEKESRDAAQKVRGANEKKKEADLKVDEAQKNLESAKAEAEKVSQESAEKVAAAQAKIVDAEGKVKIALAEQEKAAQEMKVANENIQIADVRLKILDAKGDFQGGRLFDALLGAIRAGQKVKALDSAIWERDKTNTQILVIANLSQFVYRVQEKNRFPHSKPVYSVAFSPDGKTIATGSSDNTLKLWSVDGRELQTFTGHSDRVLSVAFSPDGKTIVTGSGDKTVKLWSVDGRELQTFTGHSDRVLSVAFSPDGKTIATGSFDKTVKLWSVDGKELQTFTGHSDRVWSVAFSPDGKTIATGSLDKTVKLWSVDGRELQTFTGHSDLVRSVAFSPDGKTIATGSDDKTVKLWSVDGRELQTFTGHSDYVGSVAFSPDGKTIATGSDDKTVKLWSVDGRELKTFTGHSNSVLSVAFSPDGKTVATGSFDKTVKLWSVDGRELKTFTGHSNSVYSVAFSPDGKTVATGSGDKTVKLWSVDGRELKTFTGHSNSVYSVAFSPDGKIGRAHV
jgi:WD40 repeat protein